MSPIAVAIGPRVPESTLVLAGPDQGDETRFIWRDDDQGNNSLQVTMRDESDGGRLRVLSLHGEFARSVVRWFSGLPLT